MARAVGLPVPGPVIGLALLASGALVHARMTGRDPSKIEETDLGRVAGILCSARSAFSSCRPASASCSNCPWSAMPLPLFVALLVSTAITLVVTVHVFLFVKRRLARAKP